MFIKRCKDNVLKLVLEDGNEIESFTLLKLSNEEFKELLFRVTKWYLTSDNILYCNYLSVEDWFKQTAVKHSKTNPNFKDISKKYISTLKGTSALLRDTTNHTIKVVYRDGSKCNINKCNITDHIRDEFIKQAKQTKAFQETKTYTIDLRDQEKYTFWSNLMNKYYLENIKKGK